MIRTNTVKQKLQRGELVYGCNALIAHPAIAEILGMAGFDFVMMDGEHGSLTEEALENMVRACDTAGVVATARLPVNSPEALQPLLDTGLLGAQLPHVGSAAAVRRLVDGVKYAPIGKRGVGPGRVSCYGTIPIDEHVRQWNDEMLAFVMIEDMEGARNLPEMLEVPGADVFAIGPNDLSTSMGHPGNPLHPEVQKTIESIIKQIRDAGRWASCNAGTTTEHAKRYVSMGAQILKYSDVNIFTRATRDRLLEARAAVEGMQAADKADR